VKITALWALLFIAAPALAGTVKLTWKQSATPGISHNCVYRKLTTAKNIGRLYCSTKPMLTYTDTKPTSGLTYWYYVTAVKGTEESQYAVVKITVK
jgi:hypothetical protein